MEPNLLIHEQSPYLLQHAYNPVAWHPWGEAAFREARERGCPIFLSTGYSACHWCHVMERESFAQSEIAKLLNDAFVCVKVDREELPDVDAFYMECAQLMIMGSCGWPLNLLLTPELQPFFAASYIPARESERPGMMGLVELVPKMTALWQGPEQRKLRAHAHAVVEQVKSHVHVRGNRVPREDFIGIAADLLFQIADPTYGGLAGAPKFPLGYQQLFLLNCYKHSNDTRGLFLVEKTLEMMHRGGIYDQIGGGFARYSVDERWEIPHFEKMLYDNALLAQAYLAAGEATKRSSYSSVCEEILQYVMRDMTAPEGGFYSSEDADSDGVEGLFYTWTPQEVQQVLDSGSARLTCGWYGIEPGGNFQGRTVPVVRMSEEEFAEEQEVPDWPKRLPDIRKALFAARAKRHHPARDEKIIVAWNGLMLRAFADAGRLLKQPKYVEVAQKAARFMQTTLWREEALLHQYANGVARFRANLDDHSFLISGLISLHEADGREEWLQWAQTLTGLLERNYKAEDGAFYSTDGLDPNLLVRMCAYADGAEPSGNGVHAENLLRLERLTGNGGYRSQAQDIFKAVEPSLERHPLGHCYHLIALQHYYEPQAARGAEERSPA